MTHVVETILRPDPAETAFVEHRDARRRATAGARGPAAFVWGDFVDAPGTEVHGASGRWSPSPDGRAGLVVTAAAADGIRIGGELVDGEAFLHWRDADGPAVAEFADGAEGVVFSYDGTRFALQVWNPRSAWASRFADIDAYGWDPSWRVDATVEAVPAGRTVAIAHHRDPRPVEVPAVAELVFDRDGRQHRLVATEAHGQPGRLFVHFRDGTNGDETYAAGRGLVVEPDGDRATLDFNLATLLPCSFSLAWNCPFPPAENTLPIPVRAGERRAIDPEGSALL